MFHISENFLHKRLEDVITILYPKTFVSLYIKKRSVTHLCFGKLLLSKMVEDKRKGTGITISVKNFGLAVPKQFVEEQFSVSEKFWYPKLSRIRGRAGIITFTSKICLFHCTEKVGR